MYATTIVIAGDRYCTQYTAADIRDLIVTCAEKYGGLEHIHVRARPFQFELTLFVQARSSNEADAIACRISFEAERQLHGWWRHACAAMWRL
jgi:hypothetical protein